MALNVIIFGQIADVTGTSNITIENISDTNHLVQHLTSLYPALSTAKYAIAVDKKIIKDNTALNNNSTIALLPPFSGG
jgi:molybdopterin converting factor small subunit